MAQISTLEYGVFHQKMVKFSKIPIFHRLEIHHDGTRDVLAGAGLGEEGVEGVVAAADGLQKSLRQCDVHLPWGRSSYATSKEGDCRRRNRER